MPDVKSNRVKNRVGYQLDKTKFDRLSSQVFFVFSCHARTLLVLPSQKTLYILTGHALYVSKYPTSTEVYLDFFLFVCGMEELTRRIK